LLFVALDAEVQTLFFGDGGEIKEKATLGGIVVKIAFTGFQMRLTDTFLYTLLSIFSA
jgi:hypothetical protein